MKINCLYVTPVLAFMIIGNVLSYQGMKKARTPEDYTPRTLKQLAALDQTPKSSDRDKKSVIQGDIVPSRVKVAYVGSVSPLPKSKKNVIAEWAARFAGMPEFYTVPYEQEMLFTEEGTEHWLAVKKELLPTFAQLKKGDLVDLYLIQLGRVRKGDKWDPVLLVESFTRA